MSQRKTSKTDLRVALFKKQTASKFAALVDQITDEQLKKGLSNQILEQLHEALLINKSYSKAIKETPHAADTLIQSIVILHKKGLDSADNIHAACKDPRMAINVTTGLIRLQSLDIPITKERRDMLTENAEHAFLLVEPIAELLMQDEFNSEYNDDGKPLFTAENEKRIYENAKYAEDIEAALRYLRQSAGLPITQNVFDAVIEMAKNGLLSRAKPAIFSEQIEFPYQHIFKNLDAIAEDPDNAEKIAAGLIVLHHAKLLDSRFHPVNTRKFISQDMYPAHADKAAELVIQLRYANILTQANLDNIAKHPDKIDIILKRFVPLDNQQHNNQRFNQASLNYIIEEFDIQKSKPSLFRSHSEKNLHSKHKRTGEHADHTKSHARHSQKKPPRPFE